MLAWRQDASSPYRIQYTRNRIYLFWSLWLQFSVPKSNLTNVIVKEVSRTHSVLQLYSGENCVGTSDLLPTEACNIMKDWVLQY